MYGLVLTKHPVVLKKWKPIKKFDCSVMTLNYIFRNFLQIIFKLVAFENSIISFPQTPDISAVEGGTELWITLYRIKCILD